MIHEIQVFCPYCGEPFDTVVDCSAGDQEYIEDCQICCHPIVFRVYTENGNLLAVETRQDNE